ncbi:hypothetical protein HYX02_05335 [Candidatus Woesearchaeota archaeon]|nr:hypothetical protein [Candidatus Woesearchaeota archaeon]
MPLAANDLEGVMQKLRYPEKHLPTNPHDSLYSLGFYVAGQLVRLTEPPKPSDVYYAALSHRRESHIAPTEQEILAVARVFFPVYFVNEVKAFMEELDRQKQSRRPPH